MYIRRFGEITSNDYDLKQLRGMEGIRVREAYRLASRMSGIPWKARNYKTEQWDDQDPINMALSQANAILYSVCHAAVVSLGYSPGLGFIHTGKQLSFVYDVADIYKAEVTIPAAFFAVKYAGSDLASAVRRQCRNRLEQTKLLKRIPEDLEWIFRIRESEHKESLAVGELWDPEGNISGGHNRGKEK